MTNTNTMAEVSTNKRLSENPAEAAPTPPNCRAWEPGQLVFGWALKESIKASRISLCPERDICAYI